MITRRKFIESNILGLALPLAIPHNSAAAAGHVSGPATSQAPDESGRDYWNDWPDYMTSQMNQARERRLAQLRAMRSEADVHARIDKVRSTVWKLVGGPFEKTPLNPQITGTIDGGAYRIEKVIFESHPEVYVTSNLYLPSGRKGPFPAVLPPLGHTTNGRPTETTRTSIRRLPEKVMWCWLSIRSARASATSTLTREPARPFTARPVSILRPDVPCCCSAQPSPSIAHGMPSVPLITFFHAPKLIRTSSG